MGCAGSDKFIEPSLQLNSGRGSHAVRSNQFINSITERADVATAIIQLLQTLREQPRNGRFAVGTSDSNGF